MSCETPGVTDTRLNQFSKIKLLNSIADSIINYGVQCGIKEFFDLADLSCGAIPEGDFEQVIDLSSPHQFLQLYMQIAESRFAFAVINLYKLSEKCIEPVRQFIRSTGAQNKAQNITDAQQAFDFYQTIVLDGMPCDQTKEITYSDLHTISWKITADSHKQFWEKFGGSVATYYELLGDFVSGLFDGSSVTFENNNNLEFSLKC